MNLDPFTRYNFTVTATNTAGSGLASTLENVQTLESSKQENIKKCSYANPSNTHFIFHPPIWEVLNVLKIAAIVVYSKLIEAQNDKPNKNRKVYRQETAMGRKQAYYSGNPEL